MLTALCSSGVGVGDDPSGFDVGEDSWSWSPVYSNNNWPTNPEPTPTKPAQRRGRAAPTTPLYSAAAETSNAGESFSSRLSTFFGRSQAQARTEAGRAAGSAAGGSAGRGGLYRRSLSFTGGGSNGIGRSGVWGGGGWSLSLSELKALERQLEYSAQRAAHPSLGDGRQSAAESTVSLDMSSFLALQRALQRGGFISPHTEGEGLGGDTQGRAVKDTRGGTSRGYVAVGGDTRTEMGKGTAGQAGRRMEPSNGQGFFGSSGGARGQPASAAARAYDTALLWRIFLLSRAVTALRLKRGLGLPASAPERPLELQTFPALQDLKLESIPLEHVQGLFTLRLQLKSLCFESAPLVSLLALLAPHATAESPTATPTRSAGPHVDDTTVFGDEHGGDGWLASPAAEVAPFRPTRLCHAGSSSLRASTRQDSPSTAPSREADHGARSQGAAPTRADEAGGDLLGGKQVIGEPFRASKRVDPAATGGDLAGLQLRLGMGTPVLRWSLLERLSVCRCGLRELDPSLRLLPRVRRLSLAHNRVGTVDFFQDCAALEVLDMSFNRLESVENIHRVLGNLRALNLQGNRIGTTAGLERVFSLEEVDLSHNAIRGLEEVARLSALPLLRRIALEGNPLEAEEGKSYRVSVLSLLYQGRGADLERAAALANVRSIAFGGGGGGGGFASGVSEAVNGIALDGQLPSRKELGELTRLRFATAIEVPPAQYVHALSPRDSRRYGGEEWQTDASEAGGRVGLFPPAVSLSQLNGLSRTAGGESAMATTLGSRSRRLRRRGSGARHRPLRSEQRSPAGEEFSAPGDDEWSHPLRHASVDGRTGFRNHGGGDTFPGRNAPGGYSFDSRRRPQSAGAHSVPPTGVTAAAPDDGSVAPPTPLRRSTDATRERYGGRRRRGTRAVVIEEPGSPRATLALASGLGGELVPDLRQQSLSFCTVPLPTEDTEHRPRSEHAENEGGGRIKHSRGERNPEIVPEAEEKETPAEGFHARRRSLSLVGEADGDETKIVKIQGIRPADLDRIEGIPASPEKPPERPREFVDTPPLPALLLRDPHIDYDRERAPLVQPLPFLIRARTSDEVRSDVDSPKSGAGDGDVVAVDDFDEKLPPDAPLGVIPGRLVSAPVAASPAKGHVSSDSGGARVDPIQPPQSPLTREDSGIQRKTGARQEGPPPDDGCGKPGSRGGPNVGVAPGDVREIALGVFSTSEKKENGMLDSRGLGGYPRDRLAAGLSRSAVDAPATREHDSVASDPETEQEQRPEARAGAAEAPDSAEPITVIVPAEGATKEPADGAEIDSSGSVARPSSTSVTVEAGVEEPHGVNGIGEAAVVPDDADGGDGYRGDAAYARLLIAEHLELYFRQQVFNGVPYLSYSKAQLQPALHAHRELSRTRPDKVAAVFRETALPCLPDLPWGSVSPVSPGPTGGSSGSNMSDNRRRGVLGGSSRRRAAEELAAAGMAQTVRRRGLEGEARGVAMGEVACVVVATKTSIFFLEGSFSGQEALFSEAPRPRVFLVVPLACMERTTIGFRLQKLELQFDPSCSSVVAVHGGVVRDSAEGRGWTATASASPPVNSPPGFFRSGFCERSQRAVFAATTGRELEAEGRVSVVLLTRDRSRTFNLLQTLEPLATKARRELGLPATIVDNRDDATLEAIATALPGAPSRTQALCSHLPGHSTASASPKPPVKVGLFGRLGNWAAAADGVENRGSDGQPGGDVDVEASTGKGSPSTDSVEGANAEALPPESAEEEQDTLSAPIGRDGPPPSPAASTTTWSLFGDGKGEGDAGVYDGGVAEAGCGDGAVVVFQLLMQRWELRPWVAAPRTLVASKEQLALMDEDHSRMQASPVPPASARGTSGSSRAAGPPATPSRSGNARASNNAAPRERAWSSTDPSPRRPSFVLDGSSPMADAAHSRECRGEDGVGEMKCVDVVDLGDVIGVHQEETAPEQVMIELKGEGTFEPRRQWRLQCRTRGSAETVASTILRLSLERTKARRLLPWWRR